MTGQKRAAGTSRRWQEPKRVAGARPALTLLLLLFAIGPFPVCWSAAAIEDRDHRFRLELPGPDWTLIPESEVRSLAPDAVAGARKGLAFFSIVMVEPWPDISLDSVVALLLEAMPLEDKRIDRQRRELFSGNPSMLTIVSGRVQDLPARYFIRIVRRGEWMYQLLSWELASTPEADLSAMHTFERAFSFTEGPIAARTLGPEDRVSYGVGWRMESGLFESAAYGFAVQALPGWRLVVGDELKMMGGDAEIGLARTNPDAYLIVTPELLRGADRQAVGRDFIAQTAARTGKPVDETPIDLIVAGNPVSMHVMSPTNEMPYEVWVGVLWRDDVAFKLMAWYLPSARAGGTRELKRVLAGLRFLSSDENERLSRMLAAQPDSQNLVGPGYSLRQGVYRDFNQGILWKKPPGFWRVKLGAEARAQNEDATLVIEAAALGIYALVIAEEIGAVGASAYHDLASSNLWRTEEKQFRVRKREIAVGGTRGFLSEGALGSDETGMAFSFMTMVNDARGVQVLIWGLPENMASARDDWRALLGGVEFLAPDYAYERLELDGWVDERLGFRFTRPGVDWKLSIDTPEAVEPVGTVVTWKRQNHRLHLLAICSLMQEQDPRTFIDLFIAEWGRKTAGLRELTLQREEAVFKGRVAERIRSHPVRHIEVMLFSRARTLFALIASSRNQRTVVSGNEMERLFTFLE